MNRAAVEYDLNNPIEQAASLSSGEPIVFGFTPDGRYIAVVDIQIDEIFVYP